MVAGANSPIIIKRKKKGGGDGHHGGAWKVAYADFVTAMMAFFLLMWLLSTTSEEQKSGIADFFAPSIPVVRVSGGGDGMFGGDSMLSEDRLPENGIGAAAMLRAAGVAEATRASENDNSAAERSAEVAALRDLEEILLGRGGESMLSPDALRHVVTRLTDEGLIIEVFALDDAPIFDADGAEPTPIMREIVTMLARVAGIVSNPVAVTGHVPSRPVVVLRNPVWELSTNRASAVREMLDEGGLDAARMRRVTGQADRALVASDPMAARNDRIEITLLRTRF